MVQLDNPFSPTDLGFIQDLNNSRYYLLQDYEAAREDRQGYYMDQSYSNMWEVGYIMHGGGILLCRFSDKLTLMDAYQQYRNHQVYGNHLHHYEKFLSHFTSCIRNLKLTSLGIM